MYLRSNSETMLGQSAPQVFACTVDVWALDNFQVGDYRLRPPHYETLMVIREFARVMKNAGRPISVSLEGFTDSSGKEIMNEGLSVSRAAEVQNFLVSVGVGVHRAVGRGETSHRGSNSTEAGRRKNRCVEMRICVQLPPPPPGQPYILKISNLMREVGFKPRASLAGPPPGLGLADSPTYTPWRARLDLLPKPQGLRFLNLDQFDWNKAALTPRLKQMVRHLAEHIKVSSKTMRPIAYIRLIGHTDNTGQESYNVDLGNRRARAVKEELERILKEDILNNRIRIAILLEPSPGKSAPTADNRTTQGRALNRRVEVFIEPPQPPVTMPPPPPPPCLDPKRCIKDPPPPPGPWWTDIPPAPPGKSIEDRLKEALARLPKPIASAIRKAVITGACAALEYWLGKTVGRLSESEKDQIRRECEAQAKKPR